MNNKLPKRKFVSAYQLFLTEQIKLLPSEQKRKRGEQFKIIGKKWKELSSDKKQYYQELFRQAESEFQQILEDFNFGDQTTLKEDIKKPPAVFFLFAREKKLELQQLYPSKKYPEIRSIISQEYKNLTKEQRDPYETWHKNLMNQYLQELERNKGQLTSNAYHVKRRSVSKTPKKVIKTPQKLSNKKPKTITKSKSVKTIEQQNQDQSFQSKSSKSVTRRKQDCFDTEKPSRKHSPKIRVNFKKKNEIIIK